jgi:VWFA-related protein
MSTFRVTLAAFVFLTGALALAQTRGGGSRSTTGSYVNAGNDARNAAVMGTGNGDLTIVHGASANDEGKVEFRSESVLIQVPVVVTDRSGSHVHGLNKESFSVFENGKEQTVAAFEELTATNDKLTVPPVPAGQFRNLTLAGTQPRNVVVIALDTVNTPFLDQAYGRRELVKFLARNVGSGQALSLMLITSHGLRVVQGLTGDPAHLLQALGKASAEVPALDTLGSDAQESLTAGLPAMFGQSGDSGADAVLGGLDRFVTYGDAVEAQFLQANAVETTMNAFLGIARSLSGIPGRKSLIWATGSFPFAMDSPSTVPGGHLSLLYERTMLALNEAEVSVYPVDIRGLVNISPLTEGNRSRPTTGLNASRQLTTAPGSSNPRSTRSTILPT